MGYNIRKNNLPGATKERTFSQDWLKGAFEVIREVTKVALQDKVITQASMANYIMVALQVVTMQEGTLEPWAVTCQPVIKVVASEVTRSYMISEVE